MYRADNLNCDYPQNFKSLKIENISVIYKDRNQPIIENFNFQIHEGQKILIVGETGSEQHSLTLY